MDVALFGITDLRLDLIEQLSTGHHARHLTGLSNGVPFKINLFSDQADDLRLPAMREPNYLENRKEAEFWQAKAEERGRALARIANSGTMRGEHEHCIKVAEDVLGRDDLDYYSSLNAAEDAA